MWDVGGDGFESLSGVGILEVADLSLDEPEMESVSFEGGDDNDTEGNPRNDEDEQNPRRASVLVKLHVLSVMYHVCELNYVCEV